MSVTTTLPTDSAARKDIPVASGAIGYFPAAFKGMAEISKRGNDKHNPGQPLHHSRGKSSDHADCIVRHLMDVQDILAHIERQQEYVGEPAGAATVAQLLEEVNQLFWRAGALSQELHERYGGAPLAPRARLPRPPQSVHGTDKDPHIIDDTGKCLCGFTLEGPNLGRDGEPR